jgi:hypothetical protein
MSVEVNVAILFECINRDSQIEQIAKRHSERLREKGLENDATWPAIYFLEATAQGRTINCGPKGEMVAFALVGNYTLIEDVVKAILPFCDELWEVEAMHEWWRALVLCQREQSWFTEIATIFSPPASKERGGDRYRLRKAEFLFTDLG